MVVCLSALALAVMDWVGDLSVMVTMGSRKPATLSAGDAAMENRWVDEIILRHFASKLS